MKHFIILLLLGTSLSGLAQNSSEVKRTYAIRTNLLSAIYNTLNISYQKLKTNGNSVVIGASYMDFNDFKGGSNNYYGNNNHTSVINIFTFCIVVSIYIKNLYFLVYNKYNY